MASKTSTVTGERADVLTTAFTLRETSDDKQVTFLSPLAIGLILEAGILAVALGNLLVLLSLKFQKHWLITDILLLSLSVADFVGGAVALQIVIFMNYFLQQKWTAFNCGLYIVVGHSLRFASAGTVTLMAIDRAFMILKPLKYHTTITTSRVKKLVVFTWVGAILFASLPFMRVGKSGYEDGKCFYHLTDLGNTYAILILSVSFLLLTSVLVCYFAIKSSSTKFIERQTRMDLKNKSAGSGPTRRSTPEVPLACGHSAPECGRPKERRKSNPSGVREIQRLSRMMGVVVFLYYISWLPVLISNIVTLATDRRSSKLVVLLTGMVSLIYALANPIIYGKMSMRYWWAYKRVFGAVCGVCKEKQRSWSISFSTKSTGRSRTLTNPQLPKEQEFDEKGIKNVESGDQSTEHGPVQGTSEVQINGEIEGSDDITDGVIVDFHSERDSKFNSEVPNKETDSSFLSNDLLL